jgi:hypothetical protein
MIEYLATFALLLGIAYARKYLFGALFVAGSIAVLAIMGGQEIEGGE